MSTIIFLGATAVISTSAVFLASYISMRGVAVSITDWLFGASACAFLGSGVGLALAFTGIL